MMDLIDRAEMHDLIAKRLSDYLTDESREELEELDIKVEEDIPTVQAVPIPENATNGDVIKAMFPNIIRTGTILSDKRENIIATNINLNWWDLPYKGSDAE